MELLRSAGIDPSTFPSNLDEATRARLEALGASVIVLDSEGKHVRLTVKKDGKLTELEFGGEQALREESEDGTSETDDAAKSSVMPEGYALNQNYPNPFNPQTTISFTLAQTELVRIDIINVLGQVVRTLKNEQMSAGSHELLWDSNSDAGVRVPSGTYMYRIAAGTFVDTKTMTLLK